MIGYTATISALLLLGSISITEGAKILVLFTVPSKSHVGAYQPLMEELARRGHEVTVVTPFATTKPLANYTEIVYEDTFPPRDSSGINLFEIGETNFVFTILFVHKMFSDSCEILVKQPIIQKFIHRDDLEFDLVIYEPIGSECLYGLLHKIGAPSIQIVPNTLISWLQDPVGNPSTLSYVPDVISNSLSTDFTARVLTVLRTCFINIFQSLFSLHLNSIMRQYSPVSSVPTISEIAANASFLFLHSHPILNYPRPFTPNTIEIGGLHIKNTHNLPQNLQKFLDDAPHGVIYFSLGSNVRGVDMPEAMLSGILKAFSKLQQKILWKWESDSLPGQPKNVRLEKWLPQHAILAHSNVKLFITQGGLMSTQEATYFGVPMIAIPVMGDQIFNALYAQRKGYAVVLDVRNITEQSLDWALHETLHDPSYRENAQHLSRIFRDQPQTPMDRAVYWTEYAIRHKGAPHMRSAAIELNFVQYYLLDVIAVLLFIAFVSVIVMALIGRTLLRRLLSTSPAVSKSKKKN